MSQGRAGSTTLLSLLNNCVRDAFVQGENDFSVWWLYKYSLSVASYELCVDRASPLPSPCSRNMRNTAPFRYTKDSATYAHMRDGAFASPSMPFYRKVTPAHVEHELRALVAK